jgi:hypothetical protein
MTDPPPTPRHPDADRDHDVSLRAVLGFAGGLALTIIGALLLLAWWFSVLYHREAAATRSRFPLATTPTLEEQSKFGGPVTGALPTNEPLENLDLERPTPTAAEMNAEDENVLMGYGKPGAARLPIDVAMRLVVEGRKPRGREPARPEGGVPGTGGGSNSGRDLPEARR